MLGLGAPPWIPWTPVLAASWGRAPGTNHRRNRLWNVGGPAGQPSRQPRSCWGMEVVGGTPGL